MPEAIAPASSTTASQPDAISASTLSVPSATPPDRTMLREKRLQRMKERTVLSDCIVMLRYALDEGCRMPDTLIFDIATIDALLIEAQDDPLSERPFKLRGIKTPLAGRAGSMDGTPRDEPTAGGQPPLDSAAAAQTAPPGGQMQDSATATAPPTALAEGEKITESSPSAARASQSGAPNPDELLLRIHNGLSVLVAPATAISLRATDPDVVRFGLPWIAQVALGGALVSTFIFIISVSGPRPPSNATAPPETSAAVSPSPVRPSSAPPASSPAATP